MSPETPASFLALLIDAPLQSWGHTLRFTRCSTALFPTKSAVVGLIAAAAGWDKFDPTFDGQVQALAACQMQAVRIPRFKAQAGRMSSPLDLHVLEDFHTVGANYNKKDDTQRLRIPPTAGNRKPREDPDVSIRLYLEDVRFAVLLSGSEAILTTALSALKQPKWGTWFGRKCCVPAQPVVLLAQPLFRSPEQALDFILARLDLQQAPVAEFPTMLDCAQASEDADDCWRDHPLSFQSRQFAPRRVRVRPQSPIVNPKS